MKSLFGGKKKASGLGTNKSCLLFAFWIVSKLAFKSWFLHGQNNPLSDFYPCFRGKGMHSELGGFRLRNQKRLDEVCQGVF